MKSTSSFIALVLLAPFLLSSERRADKLAFHPEAGQSVSKKFTSKNQLQLDDMTVTMNGQPSPMGDMDMEMTMDMDQTIGTTDEYVAMAEARPSKLQRTFDTIDSKGNFSMKMEMMPGGGQDKSITAKSELEGKKVLFTWTDEDKKFKASFHESEGDPKLLEGLEEDMDLRVLLPGKEVAEGDTWDLDVKNVRFMLAPGGNLSLKPEVSGEDENMMGGMDGMSDLASMLGDLEGEATAEYKGSREVEGVKVGVVLVKFKITSSKDMTETVEKQMKDLPNGMEMKIDHVDASLEMSGEGTLHWDLAAGIAHSFELSGTVKTTMDMAMAIDMGEQSMDIEQNFEMSGNFNSGVTVTKN